MANTWVQLRGTERQVAETEDPAAFSDLIRGQRRALQQTATAVAEQGVTVPLEVPTTSRSMRMASLARRPDGRWRPRYRDESGKEHARHFDRKIDGRRWLDEVTASVVTGQYVDPRAGRITFRQYATQRLSSAVQRANTLRLMESSLRVHAFPAFGDRPLSSIRPSDIQAFVRRLSETHEPTTVRVVVAHVRAVFRAAVADRLVVTSPCDRVKLPQIERQQVEPLSTQAVLALTAAMPARWRAMVTVMAGTGLRPGEAAELTVDRIDLLRRTCA